MVNSIPHKDRLDSWTLSKILSFMLELIVQVSKAGSFTLSK